ncbi:NAD(P)-binding protein [Enterobacterales bacterium AE_CKDN230030158-1A_HGKHYDSX7]
MPIRPPVMQATAIVGAGLAGLTAARDLLSVGNQSFVVLEGRDRVPRLAGQEHDYLLRQLNDLPRAHVRIRRAR